MQLIVELFCPGKDILINEFLIVGFNWELMTVNKSGCSLNLCCIPLIVT